MTSKEAIQKVISEFGGRFSAEMGIDLASGNSRDVFRWFLASVLFGARISETIVKKTFGEFDSRRIASPKTILNTGWDGLVNVLDQGGYVRYDFKTATKLLEMCTTLTENYGADLMNLHAAATGPLDLEQRIKSLAKGIGDVTVNIFLREMRGIWKKADPLPSDLVILAAMDKNLLPKKMKDPDENLHRLFALWKEAEKKRKDFPDFEAALVKAGREMRRRKNKSVPAAAEKARDRS